MKYYQHGWKVVLHRVCYCTVPSMPAPAMSTYCSTSSLLLLPNSRPPVLPSPGGALLPLPLRYMQYVLGYHRACRGPPTAQSRGGNTPHPRHRAGAAGGAGAV